MVKQLVSRVAVNGVWYGPGDDVPADVAAKIRNPKAWSTDLADAAADDAASRRVRPGTSSGALLATRVAVAGAWYGPDDTIPDEVAAKIRNPKAWEGGKLPELPAGDTHWALKDDSGGVTFATGGVIHPPDHAVTDAGRPGEESKSEEDLGGTPADAPAEPDVAKKPASDTKARKQACSAGRRF